jgi:hypothetical protein
MSIFRYRYKFSEDAYGLARACREGDPKPSLSITNMLKYRLDALLLVIA